ncbi:hypothetical protein P8452_08871 [Trifolium repens]|nr:hypothetical protein P8452_08871 [Trifolium repens]
MIQLIRSDSDNNHFYKKVKLESQQQDDVPNKRPKFDFNLDSSPKFCDSSGDDSVQVSQSLYNPLDEPSPIGLRLKKSPSLLDLIQTRLSQQHDSKKKDHKGSADSKLKASNFPATVLKIGTLFCFEASNFSFVLSSRPIVTEGSFVLSCNICVSQLPSKPSHQ